MKMSVLPLVAKGSLPLNLPRKVVSQLKDNCLSSSNLPKGFISEDCLISILYSGPHLEVLSPLTGDRLAAWTFSNFVNQERQRKPDNAGLNSTLCEITCCVDMSAGDGSRPISLRNSNTEKALDGRYLCVGLSDGRVCVFNIFSSRIVRCVNLTSRITALQCLTSPTSVPRYLCEELLLLSGLVAVGTQEGHMYLVDFALDEDSAENISGTKEQ